jgi:hypothetical protein
VEFTINFDYLCPFARNAHEAVVVGVREGRDWQPYYAGFSLSQVHLGEGAEPVWARDPDALPSGVLALGWGLAIREEEPERFLDAHLALFAARHDRGQDIGDPAVLAAAVAGAGADPERIAAAVARRGPLLRLAEDHTEAVERYAAFGVPTFVAGGEAAFVRFMDRGRPGDVDRVLDLLPRAGLNEFKRTRIPR